METTPSKLHHDLSRTLRKKQTPAEQNLWQYLRKQQLAGYRFRRQHPLGRYIADFVCLEKRLVIELDGAVHKNQREYDQVRDDWMTQQQFHVLRLQNIQALQQTEQTLQKIQDILESLPGRQDRTLVSLPPLRG